MDVRLRYLPTPDMLVFAPQPGSVCLLAGDPDPRLAASLQAMGWRVVILDLWERGESYPAGINRYRAADLSDAALGTLVNTISGNEGAISVFLYIHPVGLGNGLFPDHDGRLVKGVFFLAKHLKTPLNEAARHGRTVFMTVTRMDGWLGMGGVGYPALAGGLNGITKTVNLEWTGVFCRALDLAPTLSPEAANAAILAELHDPNRGAVEVGIGAGGRVTLATEQLTPA